MSPRPAAPTSPPPTVSLPIVLVRMPPTYPTGPRATGPATRVGRGGRSGGRDALHLVPGGDRLARDRRRVGGGQEGDLRGDLRGAGLPAAGRLKLVRGIVDD